MYTYAQIGGALLLAGAIACGEGPPEARGEISSDATDGSEGSSVGGSEEEEGTAATDTSSSEDGGTVTSSVDEGTDAGESSGDNTTDGDEATETEGDTDGETSDGTDETGETGDCDPGTLACECIGGATCNSPWLCEDGLCVADGCAGNSLCLDDEVCYLGECEEIDALLFDVRVLSYEPLSCEDGVSQKELFFSYHEGGVWQEYSPTTGCPAAWPDYPTTWNPLLSWEVWFWEHDIFMDEVEFTLCWLDEESACGPIPDDIVRAGAFMDTVGTAGFSLSIEPCGFSSQPELCP